MSSGPAASSVHSPTSWSRESRSQKPPSPLTKETEQPSVREPSPLHPEPTEEENEGAPRKTNDGVNENGSLHAGRSASAKKAHGCPLLPPAPLCAVPLQGPPWTRPAHPGLWGRLACHSRKSQEAPRPHGHLEGTAERKPGPTCLVQNEPGVRCASRPPGLSNRNLRPFLSLPLGKPAERHRWKPSSSFPGLRCSRPEINLRCR